MVSVELEELSQDVADEGHGDHASPEKLAQKAGAVDELAAKYRVLHAVVLQFNSFLRDDEVLHERVEPREDC